MKRWLNIIIVAIGVWAVLLMPMVPHHHHGEALCVIMEKCSQDNNINDEHTEHHSKGDGCTSCTSHTKYMNLKNVNNRYISNAYMLPILMVFGYEWHVEDIGKDVVKQWVRKSVPYESARYGSTLGLRAPPACL